jgi:[acyl-carrier-protein] S-malonyltransferase
MTQNNTALVFPGQGSQIVGMGKDLNDNFNSAKEVFQIVDDILNIKLSDIIFNGPSDELVKTQNTQPALMAVSWQLSK